MLASLSSTVKTKWEVVNWNFTQEQDEYCIVIIESCIVVWSVKLNDSWQQIIFGIGR